MKPKHKKTSIVILVTTFKMTLLNNIKRIHLTWALNESHGADLILQVWTRTNTVFSVVLIQTVRRKITEEMLPKN